MRLQKTFFVCVCFSAFLEAFIFIFTTDKKYFDFKNKKMKNYM